MVWDQVMCYVSLQRPASRRQTALGRLCRVLQGFQHWILVFKEGSSWRWRPSGFPFMAGTAHTLH